MRMPSRRADLAGGGLFRLAIVVTAGIVALVPGFRAFRRTLVSRTAFTRSSSLA